MLSFIYLASQSPRRAELLKQLGVSFELLIANDHEDAEALEVVLPLEKARTYVERVTYAKLGAAKQRLIASNKPWAPILCADTCVVIEESTKDIILGKPIDDQDALNTLKLLNGRTHLVHTAVAILNNPDQTPLFAISSSEVHFHLWKEDILKSYVQTKEPFGKAGAYGIQGIGASLIETIKGSYSGIMGLPLFETNLLLEKIGVKTLLRS